MRRIILAATVGALLLTGSACGGTDPGSAATPGRSASAGPAGAGSGGAAFAAAAVAAAPAVTAGASAADPGVAAPGQSGDFTADTAKVCAEVTGLLDTDKQLKGFATQLAALIIYREAKQTARADQAQANAQKDLQRFAGVVRKHTSPAKDVKLKAAGEEVAVRIEKTAGDDAFFKKIKNMASLETLLLAEMTTWFTPIATICG
jgi:hypothetical protein